MAKKQKHKANDNTIAQNKKARFDYLLEDKIEAGVVLLGWEVKSLRAGKVQLTDSYVYLQNGEAWLMGVNIQPLACASTHFVTEPARNRKLLLNHKELSKLKIASEQKGYTIVATALYWKNHLVKCAIALGKGKQVHDKREAEKQRDWGREKQRLFQHKQ